MKYTKAQLNAISRRYTELAQQQRRNELEKMKKEEPRKYEFFKMSKYKTLDGFKNFLERVKDDEKAFAQIQKEFDRKKKKEEQERIENEKKKKEKLEKFANDVKCLNAQELTDFFENYKESQNIYIFRTQKDLSFNRFRKMLKEILENGKTF